MDSWQENFHSNLDKLYSVTPFYSSSEGYFKQEFMGEWSASSISIDMEQVIAESQLVSIDSSDPYGDD